MCSSNLVYTSPRRCDPYQTTKGGTRKPQPHPIITVGRPRTITPPWSVGSPIRAAGRFPIKTVSEPIAIESGGPTQVHMSVARAAGCPPTNTVGQPGGKIGPPTCGTGGTPGVTIGHVCMSPTLAAGGITFFSDPALWRGVACNALGTVEFRPVPGRCNPRRRTLQRSIVLAYLEDFCPDFESSDSSGFVGFAWAGS
jgi:hypothetical protein